LPQIAGTGAGRRPPPAGISSEADRPSRAAKPRSLADYGDVLTIEEAAEVLRISRSSAYDLARRWRSDDPTGLPNIRLGRFLRVPRSALEEVLARPAQLYASLVAAGRE